MMRKQIEYGYDERSMNVDDASCFLIVSWFIFGFLITFVFRIVHYFPHPLFFFFYD